MERVEMAMRLVRWLTEHHDSPGPQSLAEAATNHLQEGGYVAPDLGTNMVRVLNEFG